MGWTVINLPQRLRRVEVVMVKVLRQEVKVEVVREEVMWEEAEEKKVPESFP